jgi:hypothetical protein
LRDPSQPQYWPAVAGIARDLCQIAGIDPAIGDAIQSAVQTPANMPAAVNRFEAAMTASPDFKK